MIQRTELTHSKDNDNYNYASENGNASIAYSSVNSSPEQRQQQATATAILHQNGTTSAQTFIHLIKGNIGPGCLSLPWAFSQLGVSVGIGTCVVISVWTSYNGWTVLQAKQHAKDTYPDIGTRAYGPHFGGYVVQGCICMQQLAICTVFMSLVIENSGLWAVPVILAVSCVPSLERMAPITMPGTALLCAALCIVAGVMVDEWSERPTAMDSSTQQQQQPLLALCALLYSFEGICLLLPIQAAMERPHNFPFIFVSSMITVTVVFCTLASFAVWTFGTVSDGSITAYLLHQGHGGYAVVWANAAVSASVICTYPLQLVPCVELLEPWFHKRWRTPTWCNESQVQLVSASTTTTTADTTATTTNDADHDTSSPLLRLVLFGLTFGIAILVPNVQSIISLAGAVAGSTTALILPPCISLARPQQECPMGRILSWVLLLVGIGFFGIGTCVSMVNML
jgi:solute carrier family 36 (proton-coupled amino acid transporter)